MAKKETRIDFIHIDTKMAAFKQGPWACLAFDFGDRYMKGWGTSDPEVAQHLSGHFAHMAKQLKKMKRERAKASKELLKAVTK